MRFERGLTFLDNCTTFTDIALLIEDFHATIKAFGFTSCACGAWSGIGKGRTHRFFFNSWPSGWLEIYNRGNFFLDDPLVQESHRRMENYLWTELESTRAPTPRASEIYDATRAFGWKEVMGIPIHGPADTSGFCRGGDNGSGHVAGTRPNIP